MNERIGDRDRCLILVAHGSRRAASNNDVARLAEALAETASERFLAVRHGFLELASPSLAESIDDAVNSGAKEVVIVPYFLSPGRHVVEDLPRTVALAGETHPAVNLVLTAHVGAAEGMLDMILAMLPRS